MSRFENIPSPKEFFGFVPGDDFCMIHWNKLCEYYFLLAERSDRIIVEDNPYGELRFSGDDVPTIKSLDTDGRVIYCSSFSKILSAGIA